ncbi:hypothetical protein QAD02_005544 [Eretmocerus hayati]|uniref:Uncharacterized protein n=1 Tax=Eretmocerus hayati TaxID=131215 RepID=A0ACC2NT78_9HYME|nr:hypothetical protein QAD02_005544 [Eretmocerus hayati]
MQLNCGIIVLVTLFSINMQASSDSSAEPVLRQLHVVFRHGDRMPEQFPTRFPNDPNMRVKFEYPGSGELTNEGKMRMYRLGEHLRSKYSNFLGNVYDEKKLHGVSSNMLRTKMSLQLVQTALFPPLKTKQEWHPSLNWQPIPAYFLEYKQNRLFGADKCEKSVNELARVMNLDEVQKKISEHSSFMEEVRVKIGKDGPLNFDDLLLLHNNLDIENRMNMTMEPWMSSLLKDERLKKLRLLYYEIGTFTDLLRRFLAGFLLRQITEEMQEASNGTSGYVGKTLLYSGHDKNLIALLQALDVWDLHFPEFGSAVILELWSQGEEYFVKVLYYSGIPEEFKDYTEEFCCSKTCPLDRFLMLTKKKLILDSEKNCEIKGNSYFEETTDDKKKTIETDCEILSKKSEGKKFAQEVDPIEQCKQA